MDRERIISRRTHIPVHTVSKVIKLLKEKNSIPFLARYRTFETNGLDAAGLRLINDEWQEQETLDKKCSALINKLSKEKRINKTIEREIRDCETLEEFTMISSSLKNDPKHSKLRKAKEIPNMENFALSILNNNNFSIYNLSKGTGLTEAEILANASLIIIDHVSNDERILHHLKYLYENIHVKLVSRRVLTKNSQPIKEAQKYEKYFEYEKPVNNVLSHDWMALKRAKSQKFITYKLQYPTWLNNDLMKFMQSLWSSSKGNDFIYKCFQQSILNRIIPKLDRLIFNKFYTRANLDSIKIFEINLKSLLFTPPVEVEVIAGIDPGHANGCKVAVISSKSVILSTDIVYLHDHRKSQSIKTLAQMFRQHNCNVAAIGNGTACRDAETALSQAIANGVIDRNFKYCVVNESGSSVWSVSEGAAKEMPFLAPTLRSAVSIARRLLDPLQELVKIPPQSLSVGQYQHDLPPAKLKSTLEQTVSEVVSFVGVDLNTATQEMLTNVAGVGQVLAGRIIEWRKCHGGFINRQQLKLIKGIGAIIFQQCAGFVKINEDTCGAKNKILSLKRKSSLGSEAPNPKKLKADYIIDRMPNQLVESTRKVFQTIGLEGMAVNCRTFNAALKKVAPDNLATAVNLSVYEYQSLVDLVNGIIESKISSSTVDNSKKSDYEFNVLDSTIIHPESYDLAKQYLSYHNATLSDIGTKELQNQLQSPTLNINSISSELNCSYEQLKLIHNALAQPLHTDIRNEFEKPVFRSGLRTITELRTGMVLSGRVGNVTGFGAFVDIGVESDGLIPDRLAFNKLKPNQIVTVKIGNVDVDRKRIALKLID